jgi:hypothetical protein
LRGIYKTLRIALYTADIYVCPALQADACPGRRGRRPLQVAFLSNIYNRSEAVSPVGSVGASACGRGFALRNIRTCFAEPCYSQARNMSSHSLAALRDTPCFFISPPSSSQASYLSRPRLLNLVSGLSIIPLLLLSPNSLRLPVDPELPQGALRRFDHRTPAPRNCSLLTAPC